ncbi:hypothetical protein [Endozoicomonas sp. 8E]|uniref:hypothetical protein n=1 Tax=Endozoicomonas sp. 8E TaxID=3035692 RepID=UPI00293901BD|nr:hypothetical protein [Endozoicomonas sp. 8E]WOG28761.1 hypothetical protein P6910_03635 [Endozoicomonas sp. 8E]
MAAIWFTPENLLGRLESPPANASNNEGFYGRRDFSFHALLQVDSSQADQNIPLLRIFADNSSAGGTNYQTLIWIESGIVKVLGYYGTRQGCRGYSELSIPFDELFELVVTFNPSKNNVQDRVVIKINGVTQTVQSIYGHSSMNTFANFTRVILGGDGSASGNAKGLLVVQATLTNAYNNSSIPVTSSSSSTMTVWHWDFEDSGNPLKIITSRNNIASELQWTNTDDTTVVWSDNNGPPSSDNGGGIIIPGNGNTTCIQGTVTEDDLPVARRVFAITQAQLEVDGSQETKHAVLNSVLSDSISGSYSLDTSPYEGAVIVVAMDDYGEVWQANTTYEVGNVIRPADFQGYVYLCTVAGTGDNTEPTWWFDDSVQAIGNAQFKAKPYTRPLAHGPVIPEIVPES